MDGVTDYSQRERPGERRNERRQHEKTRENDEPGEDREHDNKQAIAIQVWHRCKERFGCWTVWSRGGFTVNETTYRNFESDV
jgi:hypothetical protein